MNSWNREGELASPYGITRYLKWPDCVTGGLLFITLPYPDEVIGSMQVQHGEQMCSPKLFQGCQDQGKKIAEFDYLFIQDTIIDTGPQVSILLCHEEKSGSTRGGQRTDECLMEGLFDMVNIISPSAM